MDWPVRRRRRTPGKYEISFWHDTLGALTKQVTVPPQGELSVTFQYL